MNPRSIKIFTAFVLTLLAGQSGFAADETVATVVAARTGSGYKREKLKDGSFKPEFYAVSNGGRIYGTTSDNTVDLVTYPQVSEVAMRLLAGQNYRYAQTKEQAKLLLVLQWGSTIAPNGMRKDMNTAAAQVAMGNLQYNQQTVRDAIKHGDPDIARPSYEGEDLVKGTMSGFGPSVQTARATNELMAMQNAAASAESSFMTSLVEDRVRDQLDELNAGVIGYRDYLADANGIQRYAGGGDRFNDLMTEVEESRYYIVVSAYDFAEVTKSGKKKLLWQTRVSVRTPGNNFPDSYAAMLKSASRYFGQNSGKLIRAEESKGVVELGDLKFLGEAKNAKPAAIPVKAVEPTTKGKK